MKRGIKNNYIVSRIRINSFEYPPCSISKDSIGRKPIYDAHTTADRPSLLYIFGFAFSSSSFLAILNEIATGCCSGITHSRFAGGSAVTAVATGVDDVLEEATASLSLSFS